MSFDKHLSFSIASQSFLATHKEMATFLNQNTLGNPQVHQFQIKISDVLRGKVGALFQTPVPLVIYIIVVALAWVIFPMEQFAITVFDIIVMGLLAVAFGFVFLPVIELILLLLDRAPGVLGDHELQLCDEGIIERTAVSKGLTNYTAFQAVRIRGSYIYIRLPGYQFHIIPLRSFVSRKAAQEFCLELKRRIEAAKLLLANSETP